jgi:2-oxoglutarate ferredoxin oxidoreductase subunit alpha
VVALCPERVSEAYDLTLKAFDIADRLRTPVTLLLDEIVGHVTEKVLLREGVEPASPLNRKTELPPDQYRPYGFSGSLPPPLVPFGTGYRYHVTGLMHLEDGFPTNDPDEAARLLHYLHRKVEDNRAKLVDVEEDGVEDADVLLFAYGACSRSAKSAMAVARKKGLKVGLFRPRTLWPFPDAELRKAAARASRVLVVEMNLGQMTHEVEWALGGNRVVRSLLKVGGDPIMPDEVLRAIEEV